MDSNFTYQELKDLLADAESHESTLTDYWRSRLPSLLRELISLREQYNGGPEEIVLWFIECGTGCTCCNWEDFVHGPYKTEEAAESQKAAWLRGEGNPLASQFSKYGNYGVFSEVAEVHGDQFVFDERVIEDEGCPRNLFQGRSYNF
jgi:hypothetical protein